MERMSWNPADLLQMSGGYWGASALHAAIKLDVFTPLKGGALSAADVAAVRNTDPRGTAMLLDSLAALNLLSKRSGRYSLTEFSGEYLCRSSERYLGHIILHHHHLMEKWARLDEGITTGGPVGDRVSHGDDETVRESFLMGMFNLAMQLAPRVASAVDLTGRKQLLDLGGGPGTYAIHFCQRNPQLSAAIFDLPTTRKFAELTVARFGLTDRISFVAGDFNIDPIPAGYDAAWLSHVLHSEGPEECLSLVRKTIDALQPGGIILIQEFILNDAKDGPLFPALFSLNMLLGTTGGQAYSEAEIIRMLKDAGVSGVHRISVDLPNGAGIIAGTKPS